MYEKNNNSGQEKTSRAEESCCSDISRRTVLKGASAVGVGTSILTNNVEAIRKNPSLGKRRFSDVGIKFHISDDIETDLVDDCAHPAYDVVEDRVIFYTQVVGDGALSRLETENSWVAGNSLRSLPANSLPLMSGGYLPTMLGDALHPRQGLLVEDSFSPPAPQVVEAGQEVIVRTDHDSERVSPGETGSLKLDSMTVQVRQYERQPVEKPVETVPGKTVESPAKYVPTSVEATVTPTVTVRNHGELFVHKAANRMEVSK